LTDLYSLEFISQLVQHFIFVLKCTLSNPLIPINQIDFLNNEEKATLVDAFNDTTKECPWDIPIIKLFSKQARLTPHKIALITQSGHWSYKCLADQVNKLSKYLIKYHELQGGEMIGILLERSEWMVIAILAVLKSRAIYVPVDPEYPTERIRFMIEDSGCKVVVDNYLLDNFKSIPVVTHGAIKTLDNPNCDDLMCIIYTSGSTGYPKGVKISNKGVINQVYSKINTLHLLEGEVICHNSQMHFIGGLWQLWAPIFLGGTVVLCDANELIDLSKLLVKAEEFNSSVIEVIPSQFDVYLQNHPDGSQLKRIRTLVLTGEKPSFHVIRKCYAINDTLEIVNGYGQTEMSNDSAYYLFSPMDISDILSIGKPIQNTRMYILNKNRKLCPIGVVGEIYVGGAGLARGYLNRPELTAEKFIANPFKAGERIYRTGDLGRWLPDGNIEFLGRKDDQVKIRGYRIELGEIEQALQTHPMVASSVVIAWAGTGDESELIAYVTGSTAIDSSELRQFLLRKLPGYMVPAYYVQLDAIPLTANGKTDRRALPDPGKGVRGNAYVAPRNSVEKKLCELWAEVLGRSVDSIGVMDDFFDLGGHSLRATKLASKIYKAFSVHMALKEIFRYRTIVDLCKEIELLLWIKASETTTDDTDQQTLFI